MLRHNQKITLAAFYRPPNNKLHPLEELQRVTDEISTPKLTVVSDFNVSTINWSNTGPSLPSPVSTLLVNIVQDNFLSQLISEPTRDKNILDLVLTTSTDYVQDLCVGKPFSDHNLITFRLNCTPYKTKPPKHEFYFYKKADWNKLCNLLDAVPLDLSLQEVDINSKWQMWKDLLMSAVDNCIATVSGTKNQIPRG